MRDQVQLECLVRDLEDSFREAWDVFANFEWATMSRQEDDYYEESLHEYIKSIYMQLRYAYEVLSLGGILGELKAGFEGHRENLSAIHATSIGETYSPALAYLGSYFRPLKASVPSKEETEAVAAIQRLERILLGTPKLIKDRGLEPKNEKDVRKAMYDLLIHVYPETVPEVPIAKQSKVYKPDIGIPPLRAAIEYKFAASEQEVKTALGGIYQDVSGYSGSKDWTVFFAVIYMTEPFLTQAQVEAEFRMSKVDRSWKPLLVVGKGARIIKASRGKVGAQDA
jgi:hypothetical protein